jgi:hypothetical protein
MNRSMTKSLFVGAALLLGCRGSDDPEMLSRLNQANDKVVACKNEANEFKTQIADLKRQLAMAMANPNRLQLTDQKRAGQDGDEVIIGKGDLKPQDASRVVKQNAQAMQVCYERALKKNSALQYQAGLALVVELTVRPTGAVKEVNIRPSVDAEMTSCFQTAALRWKFPAFGGDSVVVAQKVTLTPKT